MKKIYVLMGVLVLLSCQNNGSGKDGSAASNEEGWEITHYMDDFGEPTEEKYIRQVVEGKCSNNTFKDQYLKVILSITPEKADLRLLRYGNSDAEVKQGPFKIMLRNSEKQDETVLSYQNVVGHQGLIIQDNDFTKLIDFIQSSKGDIKVVALDMDDYYRDYSYEFIIQADGLAEAFEELKR